MIIWSFPKSTSMYLENLKEVDEDGASRLTLMRRAKHTVDNRSWFSYFLPGEKLIVNYTDGRSKTFINGYNKDPEEDEWYDAFFCGDEWIDASMYPIDEQNQLDDLREGNNRICVEYHARTTEFNLSLKRKVRVSSIKIRGISKKIAIGKKIVKKIKIK